MLFKIFHLIDYDHIDHIGYGYDYHRDGYGYDYHHAGYDTCTSSRSETVDHRLKRYVSSTTDTFNKRLGELCLLP
ncbi:MAG: hypothetical protein ABSD79_03670 [Dehalococcoidales bacterium]